MYKKYFIPAIAIIILALSIWGYVVMRKSSVSSKTDPYISIPGKPCAVFQINRLKEFEESLLYNNNYWLNLTSIKSVNRTHRLIATLDSMQETDDNVKRLITDRMIHIALYPNPDSTDILYTTQISESGYNIARQILDSCAIAPANMAYYKEFLLISNSENLISQAKATIDANTSPIIEDPVFAKVRRFAGSKQEATVFINAERCEILIERQLSNIKDKVYEISDQYGSWGAYDVIFSEDKIEINGFAYSTIAGGIVQAFENQSTDRNTLSSYMPYNTFYFRHFAIPNFEEYRTVVSPDDEFMEQNQLPDFEDTEIETQSGESPLTFFQDYFGGEIAFGESPFDQFVIVKLYNSDDALTALRRIALDINPESSVKRNGIEIFHIGRNGFAGSVFGKSFTLHDEYMCIANGNLIITPSAHFTTHIATRNPKTQTLFCSPVFRSADRTLLSTSNRSIYIDIPYVVRNADKFFNPSVASTIKKSKQMWSAFDCVGLQSENKGGGFDYQHVFIQYSGKRGDFVQLPEPQSVPEQQAAEAPATAQTQTAETPTPQATPASTPAAEKGSAKQLFSVKLDAPAIIAPQKFTNHYTGENEIFIQDKNNQIYLISALGKILWKATVSEPIIGGIKEVDMLGNKKLQIAFITEHKLYIVDRNGKMLSGYPKDLQGSACTPLSVFDYEGNKDYRFAYGTKDNRVYLTKKDGTVLKEWDNVHTSSNVNGEIKHIRISGKDYIVFADNNKTYILDRKANVRLDCGSELIKSNGNNIHTDINGLKMVMTLQSGKICFISTSNKATSTMLRDYGSEHSFEKTDKCYAIGFKKGLDVYDSDMNLVFSDNKVNISKVSATSWNIGAYSSTAHKLYLYSRASDGTFSKEEVKAASPYFNIIPLKPYTEPIAAVCNGSELKAYAF